MNGDCELILVLFQQDPKHTPKSGSGDGGPCVRTRGGEAAESADMPSGDECGLDRSPLQHPSDWLHACWTHVSHTMNPPPSCCGGLDQPKIPQR